MADVKTFSEVFDFSRPSTATYFDRNGVMQTAAVDEPRFDHDPVTGESLGVLIEESRTNSFLYSADFSNPAWSPNTVTTVTPNATTAPDGTATADKVECNTEGGSSSLAQTVAGFGSLAGVVASVYAKKGSGANQANNFILRNNTVGSNRVQIRVDYDTGALTNVSGGGNSFVEDVGDGWWRVVLVSLSGFADGDDTRLYSCFSGASYALGEHAYLWGAQLEEGAFPTSYIPTTGAAVTRSNEVFQRTFGTEYNPSSFTVFVEYDSVAERGGENVIMVGSASNRIDVRTNKAILVADNNVTNSGILSGNGKASISISDGVLVYAKNGSSVTNTFTDDIPSMSDMNVGTTSTGGDRFTGHIKQLRYYPYSKTDTEVELLTA